ncbi:hypothetical protein RHSIM_Rhsim09G0115800 [Rhododendron simsii]|uniref:Transposase-associated domain-containing protein n=1 Tax=Rhododendron simsii TaxID=118357 RepID=A0A834LES4_RHOSS|nr:hypothetical protein RHSIM_Rhsim09G0115800 [Rhododendron simsii]
MHEPIPELIKLKAYQRETTREKCANSGRAKRIKWSCGNRYNLARVVVREHLISNGFLRNYKNWVYHGESFIPLHGSQEKESVLDSDIRDDMVGMVREAIGIPYVEAGVNSDEQDAHNLGSGPNEETKAYFKLLESAQTELYPGCKNFTALSFLVRLLHTKVLGHLTDDSSFVFNFIFYALHYWWLFKPPLQTRPRTISEVLSNKKSRMDNLNASPSQLSSHAHLLQPPSQPLTSPLQDTHSTLRNSLQFWNKMSVYLQTRRQDNPEVKEIMTEYNRQVELLSEDERTIEARDRIFHSIVGKDNHGYCRTYGGGVPWSSVYKKNSGPSQTINPSSMAEIEQRIEARLIERFTSQFEKLQYHMVEYMESRGSEARQFPDAASGHRTVRDQSIGGDTPTLERGHRTPTHSPGPVEQFGQEVYLQTSRIPKYDVGEGLLISSDPDIQIDGERLGEGYCKVYVGKAIMPHVLLERPRPGVDTVGDALGRYVAWNFCDVGDRERDG